MPMTRIATPATAIASGRSDRARLGAALVDAQGQDAQRESSREMQPDDRGDQAGDREDNGHD